jgi:hypothetical protein
VSVALPAILLTAQDPTHVKRAARAKHNATKHKARKHAVHRAHKTKPHTPRAHTKSKPRRKAKK